MSIIRYRTPELTTWSPYDRLSSLRDLLDSAFQLAGNASGYPESWAPALDVFEDEMNIPEELLKMKNVVLTPHTASATIEAREAMARILIDNLLDALEGRQPSCLINPQEGVSDER